MTKRKSRGGIVASSPLIADMAAGVSGDVAKTVVDRIRLGAARQHVDAVLIYTVAYASTDKISPLSLLDLTIVGAYLVPSRSIRGEATATALLLDVRNGYPYGTATTDAHQGGFVPSIGSRQESQDLAQDAEVDAVGKLTAELDHPPAAQRMARTSRASPSMAIHHTTDLSMGTPAA